MSQVQRWGTEYDGVVAGAPAFRFAQQQVLHVFPATVEQTMDYYPPSCELEKIVTATISACDHLDGRKDGVVSRTDLCKLHFNLTSIIGETYNCSASSSSTSSGGPTTSSGTAGGKPPSRRRQAAAGGSTSSQVGKVTAKGVAVAQAIYDGLKNSKGQQAYSHGRLLLILRMQQHHTTQPLRSTDLIFHPLVASMSHDSLNCLTLTTSQISMVLHTILESDG